MAITTSQLLELAEEFLNVSDEPHLRASAGRSFYAVYFILKPLYEELGGLDVIGRTYEIIIDFFQNYRGPFGDAFDKKIHGIGWAMFGLRAIRTKADYKTDERFTEGEAQQALQTARKIRERVDAAQELKK